MDQTVATKNWGFCDLSVSKSHALDNLSLIERLGYNTVAINTYIEEGSDEPKKKKKKGETRDKQDFVSLPLEIPKEVLDNTKLNILQRVTIEFTDSSVSHKMNQSDNLKKYDIVAVIPKTLAAFQYACGALDVDIISFEPQDKMPFKISRKLYRQAVDRGVFFELMYSPAIKDSTARKNIITTSHNYHAIGHSRNLILTSGAESSAHVRGIYDVTNMGFVFGLDKQQSLEVIRTNARRLILKAHSRRTGKLYMVVNKADETNCEENKTLPN